MGIIHHCEQDRQEGTGQCESEDMQSAVIVFVPLQQERRNVVQVGACQFCLYAKGTQQKP